MGPDLQCTLAHTDYLHAVTSLPNTAPVEPGDLPYTPCIYIGFACSFNVATVDFSPNVPMCLSHPYQ